MPDEDERLPNPHPGDIIRHDFMQPWGISTAQLAKGLRMPSAAVTRLLARRRPVTAEMALRLSRFLGCSPRFWLGLQADYDLEEAKLSLGDQLDLVQQYEHEGPLLDEDGQPMVEPVAEQTATAAA